MSRINKRAKRVLLGIDEHKKAKTSGTDVFKGLWVRQQRIGCDQREQSYLATTNAQGRARIKSELIRSALSKATAKRMLRSNHP